MSGPAAIPPGAVQAAQAYDLANRPHGRNWGRVPDAQVARLLRGAARHLSGLPPEALTDWHVYVLAVGHDLDAADAENIQRAVMAALRERKEAPDGAR